MSEPNISVRDRIAAIESSGRAQPSTAPNLFGTQAVAPSASIIPDDRLGSGELDDLVDQVVERIEQRVIDELERRGRYLNPGAF